MTDVSIVIPTYNRPGYLRRLLDYYRAYKLDFEIFVADSSSAKNKIKNKEIIASFPDFDISYLGNYSYQINPVHKSADALNHVKTKYCLFCADDDFITPTGIKQSVDFLENNPDFAVAHGRHIAFWLETGEGEKGQFFWKPGPRFLSVTFQEPHRRLSYHLSHYHPTFYAVHRTDFLKKILDESFEKFPKIDRFGELLPSILTSIYGKMRCLDVLYIAREIIPASGGRTSKSLSDFISDGSYAEKYANFKNCLSAHLSKQSRLSIKESERVVDKAMSAYLKPRFFYRFISKMKDILDYLRLPGWIDKRIRGLYNELSRPRRTRRTPTGISPSSKDYEDFNQIRLHVLAYSEKQLRGSH